MRTSASPLAPCLIAATGLLSAASPRADAQSAAPRISGYVTMSSDYRNRGLSQSRGAPSLRLGGDLQHRSGFFAGAWAASVRYHPPASKYPSAPAADETRRSEIGTYIGYHARTAAWSFATAVARYDYPGSDADYDYHELSGSVGYSDRVFFTASYTNDLFGWRASALNQELGIALPVGTSFELGASLGRFDADALGLKYVHWNAGVSKTVSRFGFDLRYYDNDQRQYGPLGAPAAGEWVLSASYGFKAR
jgi:uncharacterized protein (TIGR02001 family)